jgi:hypothetical protein
MQEPIIQQQQTPSGRHSGRQSPVKSQHKNVTASPAYSGLKEG